MHSKTMQSPYENYKTVSTIVEKYLKNFKAIFNENILLQIK